MVKRWPDDDGGSLLRFGGRVSTLGHLIGVRNVSPHMWMLGNLGFL